MVLMASGSTSGQYGQCSSDLFRELGHVIGEKVARRLVSYFAVRRIILACAVPADPDPRSLLMVVIDGATFVLALHHELFLPPDSVIVATDEVGGTSC